MIEQVADPLPQASYAKVVLELDVNNHPGVMSHICNLFARRAFNVEGILCMPVSDGKRSRIWLLVFEDHRLEQMIRQLEKLEDVLNVRRHGAEHEVFERLEGFFHYVRAGRSGCADCCPLRAEWDGVCVLDSRPVPVHM